MTTLTDPQQTETFELTLSQLAEITGSTLHGEGNTPVQTLAHPKYLPENTAHQLMVVLDEAVIPLLQATGKTFECALVAEKIISSGAVPDGLFNSMLSHHRPRLALGILLKMFATPPHTHTTEDELIHPTAIIDPSAHLGINVSVGPYSIIGANSTIGDDTVILPHVTLGADVTLGTDNLIYSGTRIGDRCQLGDRVILHSNVVIGGDGFSYVTPEAGSIESAQASGAIGRKNTTILKIESIGNVVIEDDVEIGSGTTIDRANLGPTTIQQGTKLDNLVMIGHNNTIGENCLFAAQVGLAGSCTIGDRVVMGGQVGMKDHTTVGNDAILMARSAVMNDVPAEDIQAGVPAEHHKQFFKKTVAVGKIGEMRKQIKSLEKRLAEMEEKLSTLTPQTASQKTPTV